MLSVTPSSRADPHLVASLRSFSQGASIFVIVVGSLVLLGWAVDSVTLKSVFAGLVTMKANVALAFVLVGLSLRAMRGPEGDPREYRVGRWCAAAAAAIGLLTLTEHLLGWDLHIDQLLFREAPGAIGTVHPGRMATATAVSFLLVVTALLLADARSRLARWSSHICALLTALGAWQTLLGYAYGAAFYVIPSYRDTPVALHSALALWVLSLGILASRPDRGLAALVTSDSGGGYMARRLLPAAVVAPSVWGWLILAAQRAELYDTATGLSLMVAASQVLFAILIGWNARAFERIEEERAERIREQTARTQAEIAERRAAFLAQASAVLGASLDCDSTLASVARLAVPHMADWCAVSMVDVEGAIRQLTVVHADPAKVDQARAFDKRYPTDPNAPFGPAKVIRTGRPELVTEVPDALVSVVARDENHLADLRAFGVTSYMIVPLAARGHTLGAITFASAESGRRFGASDLAVAEELARRAALAVENARLYEAEASARAAAEGANRARDAFLAIVSHELRTPLSPILVWARMLRRGNLGADKARRALEAIERCAKSQVKLVEDLLDVSRIIAGKLRLDLRPMTLAPVIHAAVEVGRPVAEAKGVKVEMTLDPEAGTVAGDPERVQQVIWNLLSNAVKFTPAGGQVRVALARAGAHVEIEVSDTGQGIPPNFLPHVFQHFEQADNTATRAHGGLGLGLAIVRHIAELHGGSVHAASDGEGHGAVFTVRLPLAVARADEPGRPPLRVDPLTGEQDYPSLDGLRVLVVDDEPDSNEVLGTLLASCGADVRVAASAEQALETLAEWKADLLLTDIAMPGEDGYSLLAKIRSQQDDSANIIAVAVTAHAGREDRVRMLRAGFHAHVPKPVDPAELAAMVANLARAARPRTRRAAR